jgi:excisionase family DNA binding protein
MGVVGGGRDGGGNEGSGALLSVREVAARLGVCGATVYRLAAEGQLAHVRVLNAIRVAPRDLAAFVEARRRGGGQS